MEPLFEPANLLQAVGVILGFQITAFSWRISRELKIRGKAKINAMVEIGMTPSDWLSIVSIVLNVLAILALTIVGSFAAATAIFSASLVLFGAYPFAVLGHYDMFTRKRRSATFQPASTDAEWIVVIMGSMAALAVGLGLMCSC